jgi:hypothetical protein
MTVQSGASCHARLDHARIDRERFPLTKFAASPNMEH